MRPSETFESNLYKDIQYHWPVFREPFKVPGDEDVGPEPGLLHHHLTARGHKHQGEAVSKQRPVPGAVLERGHIIATELYNSPIFTGCKMHYCSPVLPYWSRGLLVFMINKSQIWRVFFEDDGGNPRSHL